jgi:branched-chain amino acid aminotransferase
VHRGIVMTPKTAACPEGITRAAVIELCKRHRVPNAERDLSLTEFYRAEEVFCTGTMGELAPVTRIDGRTIGAGTPGETTARLSELFRALVRAEGVPVV